MSDPFRGLPRYRFRAIVADPPWRFRTWDKRTAIQKHRNGSPGFHYGTMQIDDIAALPVGSLAHDDCCLFLWTTWPMLQEALTVISAWGFTYKTAAFDWMKIGANGRPQFGMGYWTRANTEPCLLATRGKPERIDRGVSMAIAEPRRAHSQKPECVYERIERLVDGPYLELFARERRPLWVSWGNEIETSVDARLGIG